MPSAHALNAVRSHKDRMGQYDLWLQPMRFHKLTSGHEIKKLVGSADLDIGPGGYGIVTLHQRIEEFVQPDGFPLLIAF